jgi:hypothetical protein
MPSCLISLVYEILETVILAKNEQVDKGLDLEWE